MRFNYACRMDPVANYRGKIINRWWQHYFVPWLRVTRACASGRRCRGVRGRRPHPRAANCANLRGAAHAHARIARTHTSRGDKRCIRRRMYLTSVCKWKCTQKLEETTAVITGERQHTSTQRYPITYVGIARLLFFYVGDIQLFLIMSCFAQLLTIIGA